MIDKKPLVERIEKRKKMNILKTFDVFNKENMNMFKDKLVKIILIETENIFSKNKKIFDIDLKKDKSVQVSVFNDVETYSLLSNTLKRHRMKHGNSNDKDKQSRIFDKLSKS